MTASAAADIDIALDLAEGRIVDVRITPRRLPPIGALVAGRSASEMLKLVPKLFTLCAAAHGIAAQTAVDAARGVELAPDDRRRRAGAVLAERLVEQLRSVVTVSGLLERGQVAAAMRDVMRAAAAFASAASVGVQDRLSAIDAIERARDQIGTAALGAPMDDFASVRFNRSGTAALSIANDLAIIGRLAREGAGYAAAPDLDGVVPETGPWARACATEPRLADQPETIVARLQARLDETVDIVRALRGLTIGEGDPPLAAVTGYRLGEGSGAAAVETARGRLYHHVELDAEGRVRRFQCLAPTEWNFHPRGPLARTLRGATLGSNRGGRDAIARLIAAFDPCVGYRLTVRELADA
jgi:coenzyme F420-reducing hydrogenase alpha subunit